MVVRAPVRYQVEVRWPAFEPRPATRLLWRDRGLRSLKIFIPSNPQNIWDEHPHKQALRIRDKFGPQAGRGHVKFKFTDKLSESRI